MAGQISAPARSETAPTPVRPAADSTTAPSTKDEAAAYATREEAARSLEQFKGGQGIYIGGSALVLALIILLLLVR